MEVAVGQKPLPAVPTSTVGRQSWEHHSLTIDARAHRSKVIGQSLIEDYSVFATEKERNAWLTCLEVALDDLGETVGRGEWISGIKRSRRARKVRRDAQKKEEAAKAAEAAPKSKGKGRSEVDAKYGQTHDPDKPKSNLSPLKQELSSSETSSLKETSDLGDSDPFLVAEASQPECGQTSLEQIRELVSKASVPTPKDSPKHLLLCLAPHGENGPLQSRQRGLSDFTIVPSAQACIFTPAVFALPETSSEAPAENVVFYGLDDWDCSVPSEERDTIRIVGGTFTFKGVSSSKQHEALAKALRIGIYLHLSIILEQAFLVNSNIELAFPPPEPFHPDITSAAAQPPALNGHPTTVDVKPKLKHSFISGGLIGFFTKKTENFLHRTTGIPIGGHEESGLDLRRPLSRASSGRSPRSSEDSTRRGIRARTFSFMSDSPSSPLKPPPDEFESQPPFTAALKRIEKNGDLLSTSTGVRFEPPPLLRTLAEKEKRDPERKLKGDEKAGLTSLLGWSGREGRGNEMVGTRGFLRHQEISVLFSRHVPATPPAQPKALTASESSASSTASTLTVKPVAAERPPPTYSRCDQARWITFRYYGQGSDPDMTLGEVVADWCRTTEEPCEVAGCHFMKGKHQMRWIHGGIRAVVNIGDDDDAVFGDAATESVYMWESCRDCDAKSERRVMTDDTSLFSFSKFLELLIYSPLLISPSPALCEHTTPPAKPWSQEDLPLPRSRLNIIRHFAHRSKVVSIDLSSVEDIFELRVPRLQILRGADKLAELSEDINAIPAMESDKQVLRREIRAWWQGVAEQLDKLEEVLATEKESPQLFHKKSLPRLPSEDDAYEDMGSESEPESAVATPKAVISGLPPLPPSAPNSPEPHVRDDHPRTAILSADTSAGARSTREGWSDDSSSVSSHQTPSINSGTTSGTSSSESDSTVLLSALRLSFQQVEQQLYAQLARTPVATLNDVRRSFQSSARGATRRLAAWQRKHLAHLKGDARVGKLAIEEPHWWKKGCHAIPGGNVIVHEDDWGSIIAFTLSSPDFLRELARMSGRPISGGPVRAPLNTPATMTDTASSFFSGGKFFSSAPALDPDQDNVIWHEPEACSANISRKDHPRDPTTLVFLRDALRQKPSESSTGNSPSRFGSISGPRVVSKGTPPSAWAKPDVEISMQAADGIVVSGALPETGGSAAGKILHEMEANTSDPGSRPGSLAGTYASSGVVETHVRRGKASSIISSDSDSTIGPDPDKDDTVAPTPLPKSRPGSKLGTRRSSSENVNSEPAKTDSSFTATLTAGLSNAVRYMMNPNESPIRAASPTFRNQHGLLSMDGLGIDERPHIKYDWTIGKRLKFSCTVYYAKQFDLLRRRCGVEDVFMKSLMKSANWSAQGGKSRSNFWKTSDDRYIIKTLVNAWNVADLQVLIELAPSYFRYMDATTSKATVLAKLLGFYTVEIKNLETNSTQAKADLLVMENLFYSQKIDKTFDLKGIQGRKVKLGPTGINVSSKTLFDGEWIEGQRRTLTLVHPHSKVILREAVKRDAEFLSQSNIMDYSLLLGIDEERKQIACGLVDTIGSYTFAKTLEYKAKQGLMAGGKETTVIPPAEYQERFVSAIEGYFQACPDKWSRPVDPSKAATDPASLPSVL